MWGIDMVVNRNPEYFLTIVQERSISRAAEKLYISQSSLSQYISKLERALDVKLLDRSKNPLQVTEAGRIYKNYLESNNFLYHKLQSELTSNRMQTVNVGTGTWRGAILLPEILPDFIQQHPKTHIILSEFPISELSTLVNNSTVDFAIMNTSPGAAAGDDLIREIITYELHLSELQQERFISLNRNLTVGQYLDNFLVRNQLTFSERLYTTNNTTVLNLVAKNLGFCFMVETGLKDADSRPELITFGLQAKDLMIPLSFLYKKN